MSSGSSSSPLKVLDAAVDSKVSARFLFGLDMGALAALMADLGEPRWRARQLADAIYIRRIGEISAIATLSSALRGNLIRDGWRVGLPRIAEAFTSSDGTERYLVECEDAAASSNPESSADTRQTVETVWMPEGDDGEAGDGSRDDGSRLAEGKRLRRATICVSSQAGCQVNCQFCLTARLGLQRNLSAGEIAGQVAAVLERQTVAIGRQRVNLVFMGMGEPFLNYDNFMRAVRLLVKEVGLSPQRMTVSTSGIVPGIERFAMEPPDIRPKLAISLNAPNDAVRSELMPINRKWPIEAVMDAVRSVKLRPRERVTFEYVLLGGVTDRPDQAQEVAKLVRRTGLPVKVNLIAWNPGPGIAYKTPEVVAVEQFKKTLIAQGVPAFVRKPRGRDIYAACGQLKRTVGEKQYVAHFPTSGVSRQ